MKKNTLKISFIALLSLGFMLFGSNIYAQKSSEKPNYAKYPYWIKMMDDSTVNYYEAIKAYDTFWKSHPKPEADEELMNQGVEKVKEHQHKLSKREQKRQIEEDKYIYQCKRFENWKNEVFPYVQEDGSILTNNQRLELWKKQMIERGVK